MIGKIRYWISLLLIFFCLHSFSQDSTSYHIAYDYYLKFQFDKAIYWFNQSIEQRYRVAESYRYVGTSKALIGDFRGAGENLFHSLNLDPSNERTIYQVGDYYFLQGKYDSAISWYDRVIHQNPGNADFYDSRAMAYAGAKKLDDALLDENKAIGLNPNEAMFYNNRGLIKQKKSSYNEALSDFKKALLIDSTLGNNLVTYINIANCELKNKDFKEALKQCNTVLESYPDDKYGLMVRGQVYYAIGNNIEACRDFRKLYALDSAMGDEYIKKYCK